jgi:hypothetical protein
VTVDQLAVKHAVVGVMDDQFAGSDARGAQVGHTPGVVERLTCDRVAIAWHRD